MRGHETSEVLSQAFGPLELQVLQALWALDEPAAVRDLLSSFPRTAYTTLMTTLDRLHRKGVLDRVKVGRAYVYRTSYDRSELTRRVAMQSIVELFGAARERKAIEPVLSCFVDAVTERDRQLLDDLERLLRTKRSLLAREESR